MGRPELDGADAKEEYIPLSPLTVKLQAPKKYGPGLTAAGAGPGPANHPIGKPDIFEKNQTLFLPDRGFIGYFTRVTTVAMPTTSPDQFRLRPAPHYDDGFSTRC